ncbi:MAG: ABC1 kinase family protein [Candidatus Pristimantibacillus sp.]
MIINIRRNIRHIKRYRAIAIAFVRNGFGYVAKELGLPDIRFLYDREGHELHSRSIGERIRLFLEELGPTFVKLGQIASIRPDLLPADIIEELERLQDQVPPFTYEEAVHIIEVELGMPIEQLYSEFDEHPLASASIGQVYRAKLHDGTTVAVKVQRPRIHQLIETDLDILLELAKVAEHRLEWARKYRIYEMVEEMAKALRLELDYGKEGRNTERFAEVASRLKGIVVPKLYSRYSTRRILTMEYIEGTKLSDHVRLDKQGLNRKVIAEKYANAIFHQVLIEGLFHGDPHPGNVLVLPDGKLAFIDFGMVGRLTPDMKQHFASFVIALRNQSTNGIIRAITGMGLIADDTNMALLRADVDEMREKYYKVPLSRVHLSDAVNDLFSLAFLHQIAIPTELTLLGKTLLTMEGVVTALDPNFSIFDVAEPFGRKLLVERFDIRQMAGKWLEEIQEYTALFSEIPLGLKKTLAVMRKGKFGLEITVPELGAFLKKMDQISNRLSLSIVLLSFSILMVGLIIGSSLRHQNNMLWNIPAIEIGFFVASLLFIWLIYAIVRSGRF